jgi:hypothetical protein
MRSPGAIAVAGSVALLMAGCGVIGGTAVDRSPVDPAAAGCPDESAGISTETGPWYTRYDLLASDVEATAVVRCVPKTVEDDEGRWSAVVREEVSGDAAAPVLAALRQGDDRKPLELSCAASLTLLPWLAVVLPDGRWQPVGVPVDACGTPKVEAQQALDAAPWEAAPPVKVALAQSAADVDQEQRAADAGCAYQWKDEIGMIGQFSGDVPRQILPASGRLTACRYVVAGPGQDGTWVGGGVVPSKKADAVRRALVSSTVAPACSAPRTGFVVVTGSDGDFVTVDLSCPRLMAGDALGALPDKSVDLLVSLTPDA